MPILDATAKGTTSNAYVTVAEADAYFRQRRAYDSDWDSAASTPDAEGYLVDGAQIVGATSIPVTDGTGTFTASSKVKFAGHATVYTVSTELTAPGTLVLTTGLTDALANDEAVARDSSNAREEVLIWASQLLDQSMDWFGAKRDLDQAMRWPRSGILDEDGDNIDSDTIPQRLKDAVCELALSLLGKNRIAEPGLLGLGIESGAVGPLKVNVKSVAAEVAMIPAHVAVMLSTFGDQKPGASRGAGGTVRLSRW